MTSEDSEREYIKNKMPSYPYGIRLDPEWYESILNDDSKIDEAWYIDDVITE